MRSIVLLVVALGLTGCPFTGNQFNRLPAAQPLRQPVLFNRPGRLLHEASGFEFPERYDNFQRVTAYRYDTAGLDVGIGYNDRRPDCLIAATFYVYPTPRMSFVGVPPDVVSSMERGWLNNEFIRARAEIEYHHPAMDSPVLGPATTPIGSSVLHGSSLTFHEGGTVSELRLFVYGHQWFLKYRFSYPESCQAAASSRLEAMIPRLPWAAAQQGGAADAPSRAVSRLVGWLLRTGRPARSHLIRSSETSASSPSLRYR